jgi:hypothetical protein
MTAACTIGEIVDMITTSLPGVDAETATGGSGAPEVAWGDRFIYDDPERILEGTEKFPFATIVIKDFPGWNEASDLNRDGVFRLNLGVAKATFDDLFPTGAVADYTALDKLLPHPVYAKNH